MSGWPKCLYCEDQHSPNEPCDTLTLDEAAYQRGLSDGQKARDELSRAQRGHALACAFIRLGHACDCDASREPAPDLAALMARDWDSALAALHAAALLLRNGDYADAAAELAKGADALAALRGATSARSGKCVWGKHDECDGTQSLTNVRSSEPCGCSCHAVLRGTTPVMEPYQLDSEGEVVAKWLGATKTTGAAGPPQPARIGESGQAASEASAAEALDRIRRNYPAPPEATEPPPRCVRCGRPWTQKVSASPAEIVCHKCARATE